MHCRSFQKKLNRCGILKSSVRRVYCFSCTGRFRLQRAYMVVLSRTVGVGVKFVFEENKPSRVLSP